MTKLYVVREDSHEFLYEVIIEPIVGYNLISIRNMKGEYLSAHSDEKHVYWSNDKYGVWEYFSYDIETQRIITIHQTYICFDGNHMWQYCSSSDDEDVMGSVIISGLVMNYE